MGGRIQFLIKTSAVFCLVLLVVFVANQYLISNKSDAGNFVEPAEAISFHYPSPPIPVDARAPDDFLKFCIDAIKPNKHSDTGEILHSLIAYSQLAENASLFSAAEFQALADQLLTRGAGRHPRFGITRHGLRFFQVGDKQSDGESHPYQALAVLAELGVSRNKTFSIEDRHFEIGDLVSDCEAMFDLKGEIEWSVAALYIYSPLRRNITNRYGESFTLDQIANALMKREPGIGPCLGCHVIEALNVIRLAVEKGNQYISTETVSRIDRYFHNLEEFLPNLQSDEGCFVVEWGAAWMQSAAYVNWRTGFDPSFVVRTRPKMRGSDSLDWKMISTTHHLKWLMLTGKINKLDRKSLIAANEFLKHGMKQLAIRAKSVARQGHERPAYCPLSHGLHVLSLLNCERKDADRSFY